MHPISTAYLCFTCCFLLKSDPWICNWQTNEVADSHIQVRLGRSNWQVWGFSDIDQLKQIGSLKKHGRIGKTTKTVYLAGVIGKSQFKHESISINLKWQYFAATHWFNVMNCVIQSCVQHINKCVKSIIYLFHFKLKNKMKNLRKNTKYFFVLRAMKFMQLS